MYTTLMKTNFSLILLIWVIAFSNAVMAQVSFTNNTAALNNSSLTSGVAMGIADMNGDGLDDIVRLDAANNLEIEYQSAGGNWTHYVFGNTSFSGEWSICVADVDRNGFNDVFVGGAYNGLKLLKANSTGTALTSQSLPGPNIFLQGSNFADINNDGHIDIFACHDDGISSPYENDGNGNFNYNLNLISTPSTIPSDNSGNYGSTWTDYDGDGDLDMYLSKCRLGVTNSLDGRRVNMLFQNDGNNNFTDVAEAAGLRPLAQSWASDFADIDNDGDLDVFIINHDIASQLFINNGDGTFSDITVGSGLEAGLLLTNPGIQCKFADFDNDGFLDLLVTSRGSNHRLFWNDGDLTFTESDPFTSVSTRIQSAAVGDLNHDGFLDLIAGFANGFNGPSFTSDEMFLNNGNSNNHFCVQLTGNTSNINGIASKVEIYGSWGRQIREIRAGESYGVFNTFTAHFGLGSATSIDSLIVRWPSGMVDKVNDPAINSFFQLTEGTTFCPLLSMNIGDPCNDGDPNTNNDNVDENCNCEGETNCANPFPEVDESSLSTTLNSSSFSIGWSSVSGQIGCQIQVRLSGGSIIGSRIIGGSTASGFTIPFSALNPNTNYEWRVRCGCSQSPLVAGSFSSWQPFSTTSGARISTNPSPTTGISNVSFTVNSANHVTLEIYDMIGRKIDEIFNAVAEPNLNYSLVFDGSSLPNGIYLYRLSNGQEVINEKFVLSR